MTDLSVPLPPRAKRVAGGGQGGGAPRAPRKCSPPTPSAFAALTRPTLPANGREGNGRCGGSVRLAARMKLHHHALGEDRRAVAGEERLVLDRLGVGAIIRRAVELHGQADIV